MKGFFVNEHPCFAVPNEILYRTLLHKHGFNKPYHCYVVPSCFQLGQRCSHDFPHPTHKTQKCEILQTEASVGPAALEHRSTVSGLTSVEISLVSSECLCNSLILWLCICTVSVSSVSRGFRLISIRSTACTTAIGPFTTCIKHRFLEVSFKTLFDGNPEITNQS